MKLTKVASGKRQLKLSQKEWQSIGKKAGWMKKAETEEGPHFPITDRIEFQTLLQDIVDPIIARRYDEHWQKNIQYMFDLCDEHSWGIIEFGFWMPENSPRGFSAGYFVAKTKTSEGVIIQGKVDVSDDAFEEFGYTVESGYISMDDVDWKSLNVTDHNENHREVDGHHINGRELEDDEILYIKKMYSQVLSDIIDHGRYPDGMNEDDFFKEFDAPEYEGYQSETN